MEMTRPSLSGRQCGVGPAARPSGGARPSAIPPPRAVPRSPDAFARSPSTSWAAVSRSAGRGRRLVAPVAAAGSALPEPEVVGFKQYEEAGLMVVVGKVESSFQVVVLAYNPRPGLVLHWGINDWQLPPETTWPAGTVQAGDKAVQTPFRGGESVALTFAEAVSPDKIVFVIKDGDRWINQGGSDFSAELKPAGIPEEQVVSRTQYDFAGISVTVGKGDGAYQVDVRSDKPRPEMLLHWAYEGWKLPPNSVLPPGTAPAGDMAVQSPFRLGQSALLTIPEKVAPEKLVFVLKDGQQWLNNGGGDFMVDLKASSAASRPTRAAPAVAAATAAAAAPSQSSAELLSRTQYDMAGISTIVGKVDGCYQVLITADHPRPGLVLHWGVEDWQFPVNTVLPAGSIQAGDKAVQTPFKEGKSVTLTFEEAVCPSRLVFVLKDGESWLKNGESDFGTPLKPAGEPVAAAPAAAASPGAAAAPAAAHAHAQAAAPPEEPEMQSCEQYEHAGVSVFVYRDNGEVQVVVLTDRSRPGLLLHWGVDDWRPPHKAAWPIGTAAAGDKAVQSPFRDGDYVAITFPEASCPSKLQFVLKEGEAWLTDLGNDFTVDLQPARRRQRYQLGDAYSNGTYQTAELVMQ